jgi:hypothetical protein
MSLVKYSPNSRFWTNCQYDPCPDQYDTVSYEIIDNELFMINQYFIDTHLFPNETQCTDYYPIIHGPMTHEEWTNSEWGNSLTLDNFIDYGFNPFTEKDFTCKS